MKPSDDDALQLLTRAEVGRLLRLHPTTVGRYARDGILPAPLRIPRVGPRWRRSDVERLVNGLPAEEVPERERA